MKGKLIFDVVSLAQINIDCRLREVNQLGLMCLFDGLMRCFDLDAADRLIVSRMIAMGGIDHMDSLEVETEVVKVDRGVVEEAIKRIDGYLEGAGNENT